MLHVEQCAVIKPYCESRRQREGTKNLIVVSKCFWIAYPSNELLFGGMSAAGGGYELLGDVPTEEHCNGSGKAGTKSPSVVICKRDNVVRRLSPCCHAS